MDFIERAIQLDPASGLAMNLLTPIAYVQLERYEEAKSLMKPYINTGFIPNLGIYMWGIPEFQDKEQNADYIRKAGLTGDYYKIRQMKKLTNEEIKKQLLGSHIDRYVDEYGGVLSFKNSGDVIYQIGELTDHIGVYEKHQMLCIKWTDRLGGLNDCSYVYKNPKGDAENKNEYIRVSDYGYIGFSVIE